MTHDYSERDHYVRSVLAKVPEISIIFWVLKLLLFNRLFHEKELDEFDAHLVSEEQGSLS